MVDALTRRLQVQDTLTVEIADEIERVLAPRGVGVHAGGDPRMCVSLRGVQQPRRCTATSALPELVAPDPVVRDRLTASDGRTSPPAALSRGERWRRRAAWWWWGAGWPARRPSRRSRKKGYDGALTLVGDKPEVPYERPPLSKDYLRGDAARGRAGARPSILRRAPRRAAPGTEVAAVDPGRRTVALAGGERLEWDSLLLATGAATTRLPVAGADLPSTTSCARWPTADALRARIDRRPDGRRRGRLRWLRGGRVSTPSSGMEVTIVERLNMSPPSHAQRRDEAECSPSSPQARRGGS